MMTTTKAQSNKPMMNISDLLRENSWIREFEGFADITLGMPQGSLVEDELGLVVGVLTEEHVPQFKRLFSVRLGSSVRWNNYPIYFDVTRNTPRVGRKQEKR